MSKNSNIQLYYNKNVCFLDGDMLFDILKVDEQGNKIFTNISQHEIDYDLTKGDDKQQIFYCLPKQKFTLENNIIATVSVVSNNTTHCRNNEAEKIFSNIFELDIEKCFIYGTAYFILNYDEKYTHNGLSVNSWIKYFSNTDKVKTQ